MPAINYRQYFNIDEKYYAVVTKELIDKGEVHWEGFYPHETFIQLLRQVVDMLSGKDSRSIWVEGTYGTGKSHAALTVKCLLEATDKQVRDFRLMHQAMKETDDGVMLEQWHKVQAALNARLAPVRSAIISYVKKGQKGAVSDENLQEIRRDLAGRA